LRGIKLNNSEDCVSILRELGLSISQAKIYLTLAKYKNLKATEISSISRVARPYVYAVLVQLEEVGLVEKTISKPEEFQAIPIEKCIHNLIQKRVVKTAELQQKALNLSQYFKSKTENQEISKEFHFIFIPNRDAVYAKGEKMVKNAQKSLCFLGLRKRVIAWVSNYSSILEEALIRKVNYRIIMPMSETNESSRDAFKDLIKYTNFELRLITESPNVVFCIGDRKEILLSTSAIDTPFPHPTLWSNNKCIVDLSQDYFDLRWQQASDQN
jgi:sugar-specific transcriptional regulator TrmB